MFVFPTVLAWAEGGGLWPSSAPACADAPSRDAAPSKGARRAGAGRGGRTSSARAADGADGEGEEMAVACELDQLARDGFRRGRGRRKDDGPNGNEEREETKKPDGWSERLADGMNAFFPTLWEDPKLC